MEQKTESKEIGTIALSLYVYHRYKNSRKQQEKREETGEDFTMTFRPGYDEKR